jgi:hypothetical protein
VSLYLRVRAIWFMTLACVLTVTGVTLPLARLPITTGPMGATVAIGLVVALLLPITAAWACSRGTLELDSVAVRNIAGLDLALVFTTVAATSVIAAGAEVAGASSIGLLVARAMISFTGLLLAGWWRAGWDTAALLPALYFVVVAVAGRGQDIAQPAFWAWIAADGRDGQAWAAGIFVFAIGLALALRRALASR